MYLLLPRSTVIIIINIIIIITIILIMIMVIITIIIIPEKKLGLCVVGFISIDEGTVVHI